MACACGPPVAPKRRAKSGRRATVAADGPGDAANPACGAAADGRRASAAAAARARPSRRRARAASKSPRVRAISAMARPCGGRLTPRASDGPARAAGGGARPA
eukprot:scaffold1421_cov293-Prasinococcus_capsulatus_cf.AAC.9